ncbi:sodium:proton antiporter [Nocardioides seonyuensis]|uniref:Sodium:proton antiporter n=1 Tax=Nocardioides seonyuensis TaxID=2518371 RepID=A0A4V1BMK8_9ACTN|nr:DUF6328 family protein [Nocardioides seonyuensis]QBX56722.1 sodium:proton antiporter [Nocardioides seonyuensis]
MTSKVTDHESDDSRRERNETPAERADRNWNELLQELRVSQTGVQLLAGFLVTLPFQSRFESLTDFQKDWYLGLLGLAFLTVGVTLTPVAIHRRLFGGGAKREIVSAAHVMTGLVLALISMLLGGIAFLVVDVVLSRTEAAFAGGGSLAVLLLLLVVVPRVVNQRFQRSR